MHDAHPARFVDTYLFASAQLRGAMWISLHKTWGLAFYKLAMVWCTKVRAGSLEHTKAVLGDGGLVAAFPLAYAVLLCALYAPITARLLALVFRGVAF